MLLEPWAPLSESYRLSLKLNCVVSNALDRHVEPPPSHSAGADMSGSVFNLLEEQEWRVAGSSSGFA